MSINALLSFAVWVTGCIVICIILYRHRDLPSRMLSFSLFTLNYTILIIFLFESKYILSVPFLFRTGPLLYYLTVPSFYLYVVFVLKERKQLYWKDALHLLPALIYLIDFVPLFLQSNQFKRNILNALLTHEQEVLYFSEGWLSPPKIHFLGPILIAFVYIFFIAKLLLRQYRPGVKPGNNPDMLHWLTTAAVLYFFIEIFGLLTFIFTPVNQWLLTTVSIMITFFSMSIILFFRPHILYGIQVKVTSSGSHPPEKQKQHIFPEEKINEMKILFENYISKQHYLHRNTSVKYVADELALPPYILSAFVNEVYHMHFNDLINQYRIKYIEDGLASKKWGGLTLEAIAQAAGFNNRITFLNAFKKVEGMTPTQYIQKLRDDENRDESENDHVKDI